MNTKIIENISKEDRGQIVGELLFSLGMQSQSLKCSQDSAWQVDGTRLSEAIKRNIEEKEYLLSLL